MAARSFWERLGRGVRNGWEKAKEVGSQIGEHADLKLELRDRRARLERTYQEIGRLAAKRAAAGSGELDLAAEPVASLLDTARAEEEQLEQLEARLEEAEKASAAAARAASEAPAAERGGGDAPPADAPASAADEGAQGDGTPSRGESTPR